MSGAVPRRVALVAPNFHPRTCGVGDYAMRVGDELRRRGIDAAVFAREPVEAHPEAPSLQAIGVAGATPVVKAARMAQDITRWRPDRVLIQYTPHMLGAGRLGSAAIPLLTGWLRARGIPVTVVAHELFLDWSLRPDLAAGALNMRAQFVALLQLAERVWVTTPSRESTALALNRRVGGRARVGVLPVGPNAVPVRAAPVPGAYRLGLFSTLAFGKRFEVVLGAFAELAAEWPDLELDLIGDLGDARSKAWVSLDQAIRSHPAAARIHRSGKLPLPEVARRVAGLSAYLFPMDTGATTRSGTLPLALGAGVPVVAIAGAETSELFVPDENVVFAQALTPKAFAQAVRRLRGDAELAKRVAQGAQALFERHLTWERITSALLEEAPPEAS